jgi:hypothetical protein
MVTAVLLIEQENLIGRGPIFLKSALSEGVVCGREVRQS